MTQNKEAGQDEGLEGNWSAVNNPPGWNWIISKFRRNRAEYFHNPESVIDKAWGQTGKPRNANGYTEEEQEAVDDS